MKPDKQRSLDLGAALRDRGIERSAGHAERTSEGWRELARVLLEGFAMRNRTFVSEQFVAYAMSKGLPRPPDGRAFGSVIMRGKRDGLIEHDGFGTSPDPNHHRDIATIWRSKVYKR